jgi:iron complex outermembrane receptor protein
MSIKVLTLLVIILSFQLFSQNKGFLTVKVVNAETGEFIERVNVKITETDEYYLTDKTGRTKPIELISGEYNLIVSHIGYKEVKQNVSISGEVRFELTVSLITESLRMNEVSVTATRGIERESPFTFSNISEKELKQQAIIRDIPFVISSLPSTTIHSENGNGLGYTYLRIRGFDQRRISVLINGIPQNDPEDHNVYWINFYDLTSSLQDIQVQRGAGGTFYGPPSIGGSINLVTKNFSNSPSINFESGFGSYNTQKYSLSLNSGIVSDHFIFSAKGTRVTSSGYREWAWTKFWRYFVGVNYFDEKQNLKLSFFGGPQEDGLAFYGISKNANSDSKLRKENYGSLLKDKEYLNSPQISLLHDYHLTENLIIHNSLFYMSGDGYFDFDGTWGTNDYFRIPSDISIPSDLIVRAYVNNDQIGWLPRIEYKHKFGRTIFGAEIRSHRSLHWSRIQSGTGIPTTYTGDADYHFYEYSGGKNIYSAYLNNLHKFGDDLFISADVRFLYQQYKIYNEKFIGTDFTTPYFFIPPKLGVNYNLNEKYSLYGSFGLTKREPPLKNLYEAESASWGVMPQFETNSDGNFNYSKPFVKEESLFDYEVGFRYSDTRFKLTTNFFWMEFLNEIVPSGGLDVFGQPRVGNAERTRHLGVEFETHIKLFTRLEAGLNLTLSRNRFIKFTEYDDAGTPLDRADNAIANAPELILNSNLTYNYSLGFFSLFLQYTGRQYADNSQKAGDTSDDGVTVDPYLVLNFIGSIYVPISNVNVTLQFEINNLTNKKYLMNAFGRDNFFPAAERNYFATLKFGI